MPKTTEQHVFFYS